MNWPDFPKKYSVKVGVDLFRQNFKLTLLPDTVSNLWLQVDFLNSVREEIRRRFNKWQHRIAARFLNHHRDVPAFYEAACVPCVQVGALLLCRRGFVVAQDLVKIWSSELLVYLVGIILQIILRQRSRIFF